ncbi:MAG: hypothetical protein JW765_11945 [Deltaproteobacteria bacterium]|nr:hypothetical protein [Candidatus Zymogenaceae bacterium]
MHTSSPHIPKGSYTLKMALGLRIVGVFLFLLPAALLGGENPCSYSGYLWGTGARSSFEVYSDTDELQITFTWPSGTSDIWVKAMDNDGKEVLVDRSLNEGDLFTLSGKGIFHFEIYSKWGGGCWDASVKKNKIK